jgi:NADH-quinone oxidoreductase subunit M
MFPGYLSAIIVLPLIGAIVIGLLPSGAARAARATALAFSLVCFAISLGLWAGFDAGRSGPQFSEQAAWIPSLGISFHLGVDGLSLPMVVLTTLLTCVAVLASWHVELRPKEYFALLLILETAVLGVFCSLDLVLFFLFWELELIPMFLLIGIWGGARREYAAYKFVIYTFVGSGLMLVGILLVYFNSGLNPLTFDMVALAASQLPVGAIQTAAFLLIFVGFAVKLPVFPFHTWLPDAHVQAPTAVSVILAGVLLKMGGYGMLRVLLGILPEATQQFALLLGVLAVINVLYGAAVSMVQKDLKSMVAYSSVSHMGYVLLGLAALTPLSLNGAVLQMFSHGVITGLLFLLVGLVYEKAHTRQIPDLGGLAERMPWLAVAFTAAGLASLGLPGMSGFVAEFTVFVGAFSSSVGSTVTGSLGAMQVLTILAAAGIVITAGYILWMLQRVFFGPLVKTQATVGDAHGIELVPVAALLAVVVLVGIYPGVITGVIGSGVALLPLP